jgi:hypothetical protein
MQDYVMTSNVMPNSKYNMPIFDELLNELNEP